MTFFVLAAYVATESIRDLIGASETAAASPVGLAFGATSLVVIPALGWGKRVTATALGSPRLRADSPETFLCAWLAAGEGLVAWRGGEGDEPETRR